MDVRKTIAVSILLAVCVPILSSMGQDPNQSKTTFHAEVKLKQPGLVARTRPGYVF